MNVYERYDSLNFDVRRKNRKNRRSILDMTDEEFEAWMKE